MPDYPQIRITDENGDPINAANPLDTTATVVGPVVVGGLVQIESDGAPVGAANPLPIQTAGPLAVTGQVDIGTVFGVVDVQGPGGGDVDTRLASVAPGVTVGVTGAGGAPVEVTGPGGADVDVRLAAVAPGVTVGVTGAGGAPVEVQGAGGADLPVEIGSVGAGVSVPVTGPGGAPVEVQGPGGGDLPAVVSFADFAGGPGAVDAGYSGPQALRVALVNSGGGDVTEPGVTNALRTASVDVATGATVRTADAATGAVRSAAIDYAGGQAVPTGDFAEGAGRSVSVDSATGSSVRTASAADDAERGVAVDTATGAAVRTGDAGTGTVRVGPIDMATGAVVRPGDTALQALRHAPVDVGTGAAVPTGEVGASASRIVPVTMLGASIAEPLPANAMRSALVDPTTGVLHSPIFPLSVQIRDDVGAPAVRDLPGATGTATAAVATAEAYDAAASALLGLGTGVRVRRVSARGPTNAGGLAHLNPLIAPLTLGPAASSLLRVAAGGNALDDAGLAAPGAWTIRVEGLDDAGARVSDVLTTAGAAAGPAGATLFRRIERAWVETFGSTPVGLSPSGNLIIETTPGGVQVMAIAMARGQSQFATVEIAASETAYVRSCKVRCTGDTTRALLCVQPSTLAGPAPTAPAVVIGEASGVSVEPVEIGADAVPFAGPIAGPADIFVLIDGAVGTGEASAYLEVWIV